MPRGARSAVAALGFAIVFGVGVGLQLGGLGFATDPGFGMWLALVGAMSLAAVLVANRHRLHGSAGSDPAPTVDADWAEYRREFRRSRRNGRPLTLVRLPTDAAPGGRPDRLATELGRHLRLVDRAWADDGSVFVMLPESPREAAETLLARVRETSPALVQEQPRVATFPADGLTTTALIAALYDAAVAPVPLPVGARAGTVTAAAHDDAVPEAAGGSK